MLKVKPGKHVVAIPTTWKLIEGVGDPEYMCLHVIRKTYGPNAGLVGLEDPIYADAVGLLEKTCEDNNQEFELIDPVDMVVKIEGRLLFVRVANVDA